MRDDIKIGATFPDYELPGHTDTRRELSFLQGNDPMVVTLNRSPRPIPRSAWAMRAW